MRKIAKRFIHSESEAIFYCNVQQVLIYIECKICNNFACTLKVVFQFMITLFNNDQSMVLTSIVTMLQFYFIYHIQTPLSNTMLTTVVFLHRQCNILVLFLRKVCQEL